MPTDPINPLMRLVRTLGRHVCLQDADREAVLSLPHRVRTVEAQSYLLREGDRREKCAALVSGFAFRHKLTGQGARQILAVHIPGEAIDLQTMFMPEADHNVQMLTRGEVAEIPGDALEHLALARPGVGRAILMTTLVEASMFREWALNIGRRDARSRIAHLLCELAVRLSSHGLRCADHYELPMTQEQLADATGLTPVHVNRVLKALETCGLIQRHRRFVRLPNWQALRDVGDFNPRYLHLRAEAVQ